MTQHPDLTRRVMLHYIVAAAVFTVYGSRVCPFLDSLSVERNPLYAATTFVLIFLLRKMLISSASRYSSIKEFSLFAVGGLGLAIWYNVFHTFPLESNIKVLMGMVSLGILVGLDLSLQNKLLTYPQELAETSVDQIDNYRYSIIVQMGGLVVLLIVLLTTVLGMVMVKDLHWLAEHMEPQAVDAALVSIYKEFSYIAACLVGYTLVIMYHWLKLLRKVLDKQKSVLISASTGDLSERVPLVRQAELGVIAHYTNSMLEQLATSHDEINKTRDVAIIGLSALAESRDNETGAHILRTQSYVRALALKLSEIEKYKNYLTSDRIELLFKSAPLHDIGKVGIPDSILLKPGKLTDEEFEIMKGHAKIGADALSLAERNMGQSSFLSLAREIAHTHHEKWDGTGYPRGLQGDDIPLSGRLMALADVYDALICKRVYKPAFSHEDAKTIIIKGRGTHFDPEIVDAFLACEQAFLDIAAKYRDEEQKAFI